MSRKNKNNNVPKSILCLREAAKNPANRKMFDIIIAGNDVSEDIVDQSFVDVSIDFVDNELECVARVMTREKIQAYTNDIHKSIVNLADQFVNGLKINDEASEVTQNVIDDVAAEFGEETDDVCRIVIMAIIRNTLMQALDTRTVVKSAANDSAVVEVVDPKGNDDSTKETVNLREGEEPIETTGVVEDVSKPTLDEETRAKVEKLKNNKIIAAILTAMADADSATDVVEFINALETGSDLFNNPAVVMEMLNTIPDDMRKTLKETAVKVCQNDQGKVTNDVKVDEPVKAKSGTYALVKPQSAVETTNVKKDTTTTKNDTNDIGAMIVSASRSPVETPKKRMSVAQRISAANKNILSGFTMTDEEREFFNHVINK